MHWWLVVGRHAANRSRSSHRRGRATLEQSSGGFVCRREVPCASCSSRCHQSSSRDLSNSRRLWRPLDPPRVILMPHVRFGRRAWLPSQQDDAEPEGHLLSRFDDMRIVQHNQKQRYSYCVCYCQIQCGKATVFCTFFMLNLLFVVANYVRLRWLDWHTLTSGCAAGVGTLWSVHHCLASRIYQSQLTPVWSRLQERKGAVGRRYLHAPVRAGCAHGEPPSCCPKHQAGRGGMGTAAPNPTQAQQPGPGRHRDIGWLPFHRHPVMPNPVE
jgi:hypothetical protein